MHRLVIELPAFPAQRNMQSPIVKTTAFGGQLDDPFALIQRHPLERLVLPSRDLEAGQPAGARLQQSMRQHHVRYNIPLPGWPHNFHEMKSFNVAFSSICSAKSFFSLSFSDKSSCSRFASETSMPPNYDFQR